MLPPTGNLIYKGGGGEDLLIKTPPTIPELYLRTVASDPNSTFDQATFVPQVLSSPSRELSLSVIYYALNVRWLAQVPVVCLELHLACTTLGLMFSTPGTGDPAGDR